MDVLASDFPMIRALCPGMADGTIALFNRFGQVVLILAVAQMLYKSKWGTALEARFEWLYTPFDYAYDLLSEMSEKAVEYWDEILAAASAVFSFVILYLAIYGAQCHPVYYLLYPFVYLWKAIMVWGTIELSLAGIFITLLSFIGMLFWTALAVVVIYGFFLYIPIKCLSWLNSYLARRFSNLFYKLILTTETLVGFILLVFTTGPMTFKIG